MYVFIIALRYMRRRAITWLTTASILVLVWLFVVVMPVLLGFGDFLRAHVRKTNSHIEVDRASVQGIRDFERFGRRIVESCPLVKSWTPRMQGVVLLQTTRFRYYSPMIGIDVAREREVEKLRGETGIASVKGMPKKGRTLESKGPIRYAVVGKKIADELGIVRGDLLTLTAQTGQDGEASQVIFEVLNVYEAGSIWFDRFVIVDYREAQNLYRMPGAVSSIGLWLDDYEQADEAQLQVCLMNLEPHPDLVRLLEIIRKRDKPSLAEELAAELRADLKRTNDLLDRLYGWGAVRLHADGVRFDPVPRFDPKGLHPSENEKAVFAALLRAHRSMSPRDIQLDTGLAEREVKAVLGSLQRRGGVKEYYSFDPGDGKPVQKLLEQIPLDERQYAKPAGLYGSANPGGLRVRTWREQQPDVFRAITMQNSVMALIFVVLSIVVAILILALMLILVGEKRKDIGVLRGMGATRGGILGIFLLNGVSIGVISAVLGIAMGFAALRWVAPVLLPNLSSILFGIDELHYSMRPAFLVFVFVSVVGLTTLASILPAWRATKVDPLEAIRYE